MKNTPLFRYYRVFKNQTAVTEVSTNDFKPIELVQFKKGLPVNMRTDGQTSTLYFRFSLPDDTDMFYGYDTRVKAMEMAKAGALSHINNMIAAVVQGIQKLKDYRSQNHQDLNITLLDANIRKLEKEMHIK